MLLAAVAISLQASAESSAASSALQGQLAAAAAAHHGRVALFAQNLKTGQTVSLDADRPVQTASVIKLTVLFDAMEQVRQGRATLADPIVLKKQDQVSGSGILQLLDTPLTLTLKDVLTLMITQSDNTATNLAIDKLGLRNINAETGALGLRSTWLYKKVMAPSTEPMPADQKLFGLGKTTARESAMLLGRMLNCQFVAPPEGRSAADTALCTTMLTMLQKQFYRDGIPRYLEQADTSEVDGAIGNKSGSLDAVRNDVGLISTKDGMLVVSIFTYENQDHGWTAENEGERTIAALTRLIVQAWAPHGLDPAGYHPAAVQP